MNTPQRHSGKNESDDEKTDQRGGDEIEKVCVCVPGGRLNENGYDREGPGGRPNFHAVLYAWIFHGACFPDPRRIGKTGI
jgi:hypothetical protein